MNTDKLRMIIDYSKGHREDISSMIRKFCAITGMDYDNDVLNILQIVRSSFRERGYLVFEMPFADGEIGALCYKGDGMGYVVINTSLPRVNANFAITHEIYHVFFQESEFVSKIEFSNDDYYDHEEEFAANLMAGMLLMPEISFRRMYRRFSEESKGNELDTIIRLMAYYQVPYMAALVRCYELDLPAKHTIPEELLSITRADVKGKFREMWLDDSILEASNKDDYELIESFVENKGKEYIKDSYINERTLKKVLQNMRTLHDKIEGE